MKCSYCNKTAEFKCACQEPFICLSHLGDHIKTRKNHPYENLDEELGLDISFKAIAVDGNTKSVKKTYSTDLITFEKNRHEEEKILRKEAEEIAKIEQEVEIKRTEEGAWKIKEINLFRKMTMKQRIDYVNPKLGSKMGPLNYHLIEGLNENF